MMMYCIHFCLSSLDHLDTVQLHRCVFPDTEVTEVLIRQGRLFAVNHPGMRYLTTSHDISPRTESNPVLERQRATLLQTALFATCCLPSCSASSASSSASGSASTDFKAVQAVTSSSSSNALGQLLDGGILLFKKQQPDYVICASDLTAKSHQD